MSECENPACSNSAYATVAATDPNGHTEEFDLCGVHREEMYKNTIYQTQTVEKLKKEREHW